MSSQQYLRYWWCQGCHCFFPSNKSGLYYRTDRHALERVTPHPSSASLATQRGAYFNVLIDVIRTYSGQLHFLRGNGTYLICCSPTGYLLINHVSWFSLGLQMISCRIADDKLQVLMFYRITCFDHCGVSKYLSMCFRTSTISMTSTCTCCCQSPA